MRMGQGNRVVWDRGRGHYENWYLVLSHRGTRAGFWIRYTLTAPLPGRGEAYAEVWFARFEEACPEGNFGIHQRFPATALRSDLEPFALAIGESRLEDRGARGAIRGAGHEVSWDLRWTPAARPRLHVPSFLLRSPLHVIGDGRLVSPHFGVPTLGSIAVDGEEYFFHGEPATQQHTWGRKLPYRWAWSHVGELEGAPGARFASFSAHLKRGAVVFPMVSFVTFDYDGESLDFHQPWHVPLTRAAFRTGSYRVTAQSATMRVRAELSCRPEDMIFAELVDPDGDAAFCHNSCSSRGVFDIERRGWLGRWRRAARLVAPGTAQWEWGGRAGDRAHVRREHVAIDRLASI